MDPPQREPRKLRKLQTPGIHSRESMPEAGRKILGFHFERMVQHEPGTRMGEDISDLHKMRVATRRMRVGITIFEPYYEKKGIKPFSKGLRSTAKALGRVRDYDVFLDHYYKYRKSVSGIQTSGDDKIIAGWEKVRDKARSKMIRYLEGKKYQKFLQDFDRFLHTQGEGSKPIEEIRPYFVREAVPQIIRQQLSAIHAYDQIMEIATIEDLHALRIEFKKLRYAVEFFQDVLGREAKMVITDIIKFQDHLGNLNDADVASGILNNSLSRWEDLQASLPVKEQTNPNIVTAYLEARENEKQNLVSTFPQTWKLFMQREFGVNLAAALSGI